MSKETVQAAVALREKKKDDADFLLAALYVPLAGLGLLGTIGGAGQLIYGAGLQYLIHLVVFGAVTALFSFLTLRLFVSKGERVKKVQQADWRAEYR